MRRLVLIVLFCLCWPLSAAGQLSVEARGGMSIGSHSSTLAGLEVLPWISADLFVKKDLGRYALMIGGSYSSFGCEDGFCRGGGIVGIRHMAGVVGVEAGYGIAWMRTGGGMGFTEIRSESEFGPVVFVAGGVKVRIWRFLLLPGVSYRWMNAEGKETIVANMDLGISYRLGSER